MRSHSNPRRPRATATALVIAGAALLPGCEAGRSPTESQRNVEAAPASEPGPVAAIPLPEPPLDREALLLSVARVASASAAGADDRKVQAGLAGRRFTIRIRFGCSGPSTDLAASSMGWTYNETEQALKVRAVPDVSGELPLMRGMAGDDVEAAEGFWIPRPWLFADTCPAAPAGPTPEAPVPGSVAVMQFFTASDSRTERRSTRSFETVQRMEPESAPGAAGFTLVLRGRLEALPDGRVIRCVSVDANARPACVASVEFGRVSIENAATGASLAEWGAG